MIRFTKHEKYIYVTVDGADLPQTIIKCATNENEEILKICQDWLDMLGLTNAEYQVNIRIH